MKALLVSADNFEDSELLVPYYRLQEAGVAVIVASTQSRGAIMGKHGIKQVWHITLFSNLNLVIVVAVSFGLQVWSQHNVILGRLLKTSSMPFTDCLLLLALGTIPLLVLEGGKTVRRAKR